MTTDLFGQPVVEAPPQPASPAEKPKPAKDRIRGSLKVEISGEIYRVEMRTSGITVRRCGKRHVSHMSIQAIVDAVTGQAQLKLDQ